MTDAVLEFPLKEKVRNYLRVEQLLRLMRSSARSQDPQLQFVFFEQLFVLLDLVERLDLRTDILKDLDVHEKSLVYWSQHPKIDSDALDQALKHLLAVRADLKSSTRFGIDLKDDKFLSGIRQRFAIPGGACAFDLPNLHYWLNLPADKRQHDFAGWLNSLKLLEDAVSLNMSFIRERGSFSRKTAENGFYQGAAEDKNELIRIKYQGDNNIYPTFSGNKYRYAIRFMRFVSDGDQSSATDADTPFSMAVC
ncbi:cell division protein ZapD [Alteromonas halophila]|uniref:Cell division protein ZapD n=1 Tax=Alteromonas halophila TaxID=516698 RepID=A0A918JQS0_9ALTE|nr:cell division protein ZapD [Alteromonas halophila]GGW94063.1 cell division protein ZapD [Alteromonas halophila]